jgi:hypothetical protein
LIAHLCESLDKFLEKPEFENEDELLMADYIMQIFITSFDEWNNSNKNKNEIMVEFTYDRLIKCLDLIDGVEISKIQSLAINLTNNLLQDNICEVAESKQLEEIL